MRHCHQPDLSINRVQGSSVVVCESGSLTVYGAIDSGKMSKSNEKLRTAVVINHVSIIPSVFSREHILHLATMQAAPLSPFVGNLS